MSSNSTIYVGFWINRSKGSIAGSTLTLSNSNGAVLIAALAIFIQLAGGQSWSIICFITHQLRVSKKAKSGLHHQQQAILRNNTSDVKNLWQLTILWWSWRTIASRAFNNSIGLILVGFLHLAIFGATGVLSSHITVVGSQVLVASNPNCGPWKQELIPRDPAAPPSQDEVAHDSYEQQRVTASEQYLQSCIKGQESLPECNRFQLLRLNWTSETVPCPFQDLCLGPPNSSLRMDTGLLDSREDLGINGGENDRVKLRRTVTCSPITTKGYTRSGTTSLDYRVFNRNNTFGHTTINYTAAFYGASNVKTGLVGLGDSTLENITSLLSNFREVATIYYNKKSSLYDIIPEIGDLDWGFSPIPALSIPNSTLSLVFSQFYGTYIAPSDDLWLSAHEPVVIRASREGAPLLRLEQFGPDQPLSVLACTEQYQFCNPLQQHGPPICTAPTSLAQLDKFADKSDYFSDTFSQENQIATARAIALVATGAYMWAVLSVSPPPLLARGLTIGQMSLPPAPNQWILETENWFEIGLATLQRLTVEYITGPPPQYAHNAFYNTTNREPGMDWLCQNQIVRRKDFTNFSTLSIGLVFGLGAFVIILSFYLETLLGQIRLKWPKGHWKQTAWWSEGTLQLQRRAFEGMGVTDWKATEWEVVPVTTKEKVWRGLEIQDETLPLVEKRERNLSGVGDTSEQEGSHQDIARAQTHVPEGTPEDQEGVADQFSSGTQVTAQEDAPEERLEEAVDQVNSSTEIMLVEQGSCEPHSEPKRLQIEMHGKSDQQTESKSNQPNGDEENVVPAKITQKNSRQVTPETTSSSRGHDADQHLNEHPAQELSREDKPEDQKITVKNVPHTNYFTSLATNDADEYRERSPEKQREDDPTHATASK